MIEIDSIDFIGKWHPNRPRGTRGLCLKCNKNLQKKFGKSERFSPFCSVCLRKRYGTKSSRGQRPWRKYVKTYCEKCGFIAEHSCQLDVDHIDGNKTNNSENNLQTLCANCHRLKTFINKDWEDKIKKAPGLGAP